MFERGQVCNVRSNGYVTARKSIVVKLFTASCKQCVQVCYVDTGPVDLRRVGTWKVDFGSKMVGHHRF